MGRTKKSSPEPEVANFPAITEIGVARFKSIYDRQTIELSPLTILAGPNSSGKSAIMQPLLLLKQTLEASFDPGPLLLNGNNARFTSSDQFLSRLSKDRVARDFEVSLTLGSNGTTSLTYGVGDDDRFRIVSQTSVSQAEKGTTEVTLRPGMKGDEIERVLPRDLVRWIREGDLAPIGSELSVNSSGCFLSVEFKDTPSSRQLLLYPGTQQVRLTHGIQGCIHLSGYRGSPERSYQLTGVGPTFPGVFETYTASVLSQWADDGEQEKLNCVGGDLERLGLTWKAEANRLNDAQVQIKVGRLPHLKKGGARDLVDIADVGFGVSQSLPIIVALHKARPGQLVYLEQPEIHLHPRAQVAMAELLIEAAERGVRVVTETHSRLLLQGLQTVVARRSLKDLVRLHWFQRDKEGATQVTPAALDEYGRFGDWPEDFDDVSLDAQSEFLDTVSRRMSEAR